MAAVARAGAENAGSDLDLERMHALHGWHWKAVRSLLSRKVMVALLLSIDHRDDLSVCQSGISWEHGLS